MSIIGLVIKEKSLVGDTSKLVLYITFLDNFKGDRL
jgi:hypothetical protein